MRAVLTTSWDDGHPLDHRVAGLLAKYGLPGTFYIPRRAPNPVLEPSAIRDLAGGFEIAAHTITHGNLRRMSRAQAHAELADSKRYLEDCTGQLCTTFAPPGGRFRPAHLTMAAAVGFRGFRTVEMMSLDRPVLRAGLAVMPTTLQVFPHPASSYLRNAAAQCCPGNLRTFFAHARGAGLPGAAEALVAAAIRRGGVFHLWGHSWEIEQHGLWPVLERILSAMSDARGECRRATNQELCEEVWRHESIAGTVADPDLP